MKTLHKLILISSLLFSSLLMGQAQESSLRWGSEAKANKASGYLYSLGWYNGYLYNIEIEQGGTMKMGGSLHLEKLSKNMQLTLSKEINIDGLNAWSALHFLLVEGKINIYTILRKEDNRKEGALFCFSYDLNGRLKNKKMVFDFKEYVFDDYESSGGFSSYAFGNSTNKEKVIYAFTLKKKKSEEYKMVVVNFDPDGSNSKLVEWGSRKEGISSLGINQLLSDNNGNIIINYYTRTDNGSVSQDNLTVINEGGNEILDEKLVFDDFFLDRVEAKISEDNLVYFTGMLGSERKGKQTHNGFFIAKLNDEKTDIEQFKPYPYTEEFLTKLGYKVKENGKVNFLGKYEMNIELKKSGGGYLIANHVERYRSAGISNKELVILPFNQDIEVEAPIAIPRELKSYAPLLNGLGYFSFIHNEKLNIVYTDHIKNVNVNSFDNIKAADNPKDKTAAIYMATLKDGDKSFERKILSFENKINGYLIPDKCQSEDGKYVINVGNKSKVLYGELKFK